MTVSQRGTPVIATGTTSVTGTWPTGSTQVKGDLLVAVVGAYGSTENVSGATPAGWFQAADNYNYVSGTGDALWHGIYVKVAAGGDSAPAFSITGSGSTNMACVLYDLSDSSGYTPQFICEGDNFGTTGTLTVTTGTNVPSAGCFAISGAICANGTTSAATTWTTPASWSLGGDQTASGVSQCASYYYGNPPSGSTLSCLFTHSRTSNVQAGSLIVVQPPAAGALAVTAAMGGSTYEGLGLSVVVLTGAAGNPAGTTGTATGTTGNVSITPAASGSWIYGAVADNNADTTLTPESSCTFSMTVQDDYNATAYGAFRTTNTSTAAVPVAVGTSAALTGGGVAAVEIKSAGTLAEDSPVSWWTWTPNATSTLTNWFTPPPGSLIIAMLAANGSTGTATATVTDTLGLTWKQVASTASTGDGYAGVWLAQVPETPAWHSFPVRGFPRRQQPLLKGRVSSNPGSLPPRTYYVSPAGSDSNSGLAPGTAWQTVTKVNNTVLHPGDTVLFQGGQTFSGTMLQPGQAGTAGSPITFGSYGAGQATITNSSDSAIYVYEAGGITVENLIITGPGAATAGAGGYVGVFFNRDLTGYAAPIVVTGCMITGWADGILAGAADAAGGYSGITFTNNQVSANRDAGINVYGSGYSHQNVVITGNSAFNQTGYSGNTTTSSGHGIVVGNASGGTISQNVTYGNGASCGCTTAGPVGNWAYSSQNLVIEYNVSYGNLTASPGNADGDGFDLDDQCVNCTLQYNIAYENDGAGIACYSDDSTWSGNVIRYNVTWGNSVTNPDEAEIMLTGGAFANCDIYGNTFIGQTNAQLPSVVLLYGASFTSVNLWNNIFYTASSGVALMYADTAYTGVTFQGNLYYSAAPFSISWGGTGYSSLAAWRTGTSQEILSGHNTGRQANPQFNAPATAPAVTSPGNLAPAHGLQLAPGSPAAAQGLNLGADFSVTPGTQDFFGNPVGYPLWTGAYQGTPVPPPGIPVRARLPRLQPRAGRVASNPGSPASPAGPVFRQKTSPARIHPSLPPRGRIGSSAGIPVHNPTPGPVFVQATSPARKHPALPPRGRIASGRGGPVRNPPVGPPVYPLEGPVRYRLPQLAPRAGRIASSAGAPVRDPVPGPVFYPARSPARARIPQNAPRGRVNFNAGTPVHNPTAGPVFRQAVRPIRTVIPRNAPRGRVSSNPGGPVHNPAPGVPFARAQQAVRARYLNPVYVLGDPGLIYVNSRDGTP